MSIGRVIKKIGTGVGSAATGIGKAAVKGGSTVVSELAEALKSPQEPAMEAPGLPEVDESAWMGPAIQLPELDPNDPDYAEKQKAHEALIKLSQLQEEAARAGGQEYRKGYEELVSHIGSKPQPRKYGALELFAIGMGSPRAQAQAGERNIAFEDASEKERAAILQMRSDALKGQIGQLMEAGKFKQALMQSQVLADLAEIGAGKAHRRKLEEIEAQGASRAEVARIRAKGAIDTVKARAEHAQQGASGIKLQKIKSASAQAVAQINGLNQLKDMLGQNVATREQYEAVLEEYENRLDEIEAEPDEAAAPATAAAPPAAKPAAAAPTGKVQPAAKAQEDPNEKVIIVRGGVRGTISRKNIKPGDTVEGPANK